MGNSDRPSKNSCSSSLPSGFTVYVMAGFLLGVAAHERDPAVDCGRIRLPSARSIRLATSVGLAVARRRRDERTDDRDEHRAHHRFMVPPFAAAASS